ncbi:MAG TPA: DUF4142 domain-containing protein [Rhizomicrobium sp.]
MKKSLLLAASALSLTLISGGVLAAPADQPGHQSPAPGTNNETVSAVKDATAGVVGEVSAQMTSTARGFVTAAATSDMYEVEAGKIAEDRSRSADVKAFAKKMVKAHTETTDQVKAILAQGTVDAAPPAHLDDRRQGMIDDLRGASAADFDTRYLSQQVAAHNEALILMQGYAKDGDVIALKKFAAATAPVVQDHLNMAEDLQKQNDAMLKKAGR